MRYVASPRAPLDIDGRPRPGSRSCAASLALAAPDPPSTGSTPIAERSQHSCSRHASIRRSARPPSCGDLGCVGRRAGRSARRGRRCQRWPSTEQPLLRVGFFPSTGPTGRLAGRAGLTRLPSRISSGGHEPGNVRNRARPKTVLTESTGEVGIEVPRDRVGTFEPQKVKKRQRRRWPAPRWPDPSPFHSTVPGLFAASSLASDPLNPSADYRDDHQHRRGTARR